MKIYCNRRQFSWYTCPLDLWYKSAYNGRSIYLTIWDRRPNSTKILVSYVGVTDVDYYDQHGGMIDWAIQDLILGRSRLSNFEVHQLHYLNECYTQDEFISVLKGER